MFNMYNLNANTIYYVTREQSSLGSYSELSLPETYDPPALMKNNSVILNKVLKISQKKLK